MKRFLVEDARWVLCPLVLASLAVGGWYLYDWITAPSAFCYCLF